MDFSVYLNMVSVVDSVVCLVFSELEDPITIKVRFFLYVLLLHFWDQMLLFEKLVVTSDKCLAVFDFKTGFFIGSLIKLNIWNARERQLNILFVVNAFCTVCHPKKSQ